ncbi:MAG: FkbM family methyltransferase [Planctomyces sp.]|nr:FkbM family methyltransferase [Planctomyces sp.]
MAESQQDLISTLKRYVGRILGRKTTAVHLRPNNSLIETLESCFRGQDSLTFVKVGANDGVTNDPCGELLLRDRRWKGILIEPVPSCLESLKAVFSDVTRFSIVNAAIGRSDSTASFYYIDSSAETAINDLPYWYNQIGSFRKEHIYSHFGDFITPFVREIQVEVKPLSAVLEKLAVKSVEFLHVDTEGHDLVVMQSLDFSKYRPQVVFVEHKHLSDEDRKVLVELLRSEGYSIEDFGNDFMATRNARET